MQGDQILHKLEASGRLVKWAIELSKFYISYKPRATIKAHAMVNFVEEFTESLVEPSHIHIAIGNNKGQIWQMIVDGSSGEQSTRAGWSWRVQMERKSPTLLDWSSRPQTIRLNMRL